MINSIASIHASVVLSCMPHIQNTLENLSHRIKKYLNLESADRPIGSGFIMVLTWISSNVVRTRDSLAFPRVFDGIVIILYDV